ncbi:hypothetical protein C0584_06095 [Candidatus Parcubacteria bacterium]|nr:MAG: hypothetical protein C0584_06095 [Candidatus Parcubacteria bacterium]
MAKKREYKVGIDIGGTKMFAVLFDGERIVEEYTLATPKDSIEHFIIMIVALLEPLLEKAQKDKAQVNGIGLGIAGVVDFKTRKVTRASNIKVIDNTDFVSQLEKKLGLPVFIDNDANCSLRAEINIGSARKFDNACLIVIGTGIGSSWWNNGDVHLGVDGCAGEIGHNVIDYENKTTLEEAYHKLTQKNPLNMATEAYRGDVLAIKSFEEFGSLLGIALANLVNTVNPGIIVLYGGGTGAADLFMPNIKKMMKEYIWEERARKTKVVLAKLGNKAGAIGAAMLVE